MLKTTECNIVVEFPYRQPGLPPLHIRAVFEGASKDLLWWEAYFPPKGRRWKLYPVPPNLQNRIDAQWVREEAYHALEDELEGLR